MQGILTSPLLNLIHEKQLADEQVLEAIQGEHNLNGELIYGLVHNHGVLDLAAQLALMAEYLGTDVIDVTEIDYTEELLALIPLETAHNYKCLPIGLAGETLHLSMVDPLNPTLLDELSFQLKRPVQIRIGSPEAIQTLIDDKYSKDDFRGGSGRSPESCEQFCMHCGHKITYLAHQAGSNVFCPKCGQSVQIQAGASNPVKAESSQIAATSSDIMPPADVHLSIEGQQSGPYTDAEIQGHLKTGQVAPTTLARREGMSGWLPLNELLEPAIDQTVATNPQPTTATSANPQPEEDDLENVSQEIKPSGVEQGAVSPLAAGFLIICTGIGIWAGLSGLYSWVFSPAKNEEVQNEEGGLAIKDIVGTYQTTDKDPYRKVFLDDGNTFEYTPQNEKTPSTKWYIVAGEIHINMYAGASQAAVLLPSGETAFNGSKRQVLIYEVNPDSSLTCIGKRKNAFDGVTMMHTLTRFHYHGEDQTTWIKNK